MRQKFSVTFSADIENDDEETMNKFIDSVYEAVESGLDVQDVYVEEEF